MKYALFVDERIEDKLVRFPRDVVRSIDKALLALRDDPRPRGCRKIRGTKDCWRITVRKDYRILYRLDDEAKAVEVYAVTRKEKDIYRRR